MILDPGPYFNFKSTLTAHGWIMLAPFLFTRGESRFEYVYYLDGRTRHVEVIEENNKLSVKSKCPRAKEIVSHILRLDESFADWFEIAEANGLENVSKLRLGPMMRSATVFEDMVKTICTTNCNWSFTLKMTAALVEKLGAKDEKGRRSFPTPQAMASKNLDFFKAEIRSGYRSEYLLELARNVSDGKLDPETWIGSDASSKDLKREILSVKGFGNYAADNLLKLIGRYDCLALDSYLRGTYYKIYNDGKACNDREINARYDCFGEWKGLAIWFDLAEKSSSPEVASMV